MITLQKSNEKRRKNKDKQRNLRKTNKNTCFLKFRYLSKQNILLHVAKHLMATKVGTDRRSSYSGVNWFLRFDYVRAFGGVKISSPNLELRDKQNVHVFAGCKIKFSSKISFH